MNRHLSERAKKAKDNKRRQSESSLVSADEAAIDLAAELLTLSKTSKQRAFSMIRLLKHLEDGLIKKAVREGMKMAADTNPPGDIRMAAILLEYEHELEKIEFRRQHLIRGLRDDLELTTVYYAKRMDQTEGFDDPEQAAERLAKKSSTVNIIQEVKKSLQKDIMLQGS